MRECGLTAGLTSNETTRSEVSLRSEFDQTLIERSAHKYRYANLTMISPADAEVDLALSGCRCPTSLRVYM